MKGLDGMIRLSKWRLDEARKELAAAQNAVDQIDQGLANLQAALDKESGFAGESLAGFSFGPYAAASFAQRAKLQEQRAKADAERADKEEVVRAAFQELKKFEILAERQLEQAKFDAKKRDAAALDELGLQRHARNQD
ncbi:flagellar export protein FliJ [Iodidimonas gelatinilytica]|uniref:Flagellar export protein FliJ n=1 Tax=Iodidimonas gelatinilytica TaxID=1236966 RepID=A0A5A7MR55_9PROT|nr:flagellar FliJ family protein [Iodidimonas gelatinilytica]GEQ98094.1 flagellar export protein FliJ [Iodidimonas gelatinilytica]